MPRLDKFQKEYGRSIYILGMIILGLIIVIAFIIVGVFIGLTYYYRYMV